ncbi:MAG TPA: hypothetical protein VEC37_01470, partial [Bacillota bacterium]|nr:hypothetical protein [Bacillota bacterium]
MKNSKMFFMLLISIVVISTITIPQANSCAVMPYEVVQINELVPTDITFFSSGLGADLFLKPYLFVTHPEAENGGYSYTSATDIDRQTNLDEWVAFLNSKVKDKDLEAIIYTMDKAPLQVITRQLSSKKAVVKQTNPALNYLVQNRRFDILEYLVFAKNCENFAYYSEWSWDYGAELEKRRDPQKMQQLINEGLLKYR